MVSLLYALGANGIKVPMSKFQNLSWWLVAPMLLLLAVLLGGFELKPTLWHFLWLVVMVNTPTLYRLVVWFEDRWLRQVYGLLSEINVLDWGRIGQTRR